jgi:hypothetical protein
VLFLLFLSSCAPAQPEAAPEAPATSGSEQLPPEPVGELPPAPTPEPAAVPPEHAMPGFAAIVMHEVKDFDTWKAGFDGNIEARKQAGIVAHALMRGADNEKLVVLYLPASDPDKLQALFNSPDLKDAMKKAGVKGKPTIYAFKALTSKMAPPNTTSVGAILAYEVKDFAAFQQALDAQADARATAGISGIALGQGIGKPTSAYVYLQSGDLTKLKQYLAAKETKQAMTAAGARAPTVTLVRDAEMVPYH